MFVPNRPVRDKLWMLKLTQIVVFSLRRYLFIQPYFGPAFFSNPSTVYMVTIVVFSNYRVLIHMPIVEMERARSIFGTSKLRFSTFGIKTRQKIKIQPPNARAYLRTLGLANATSFRVPVTVTCCSS
jgi:hypothetical protein